MVNFDGQLWPAALPRRRYAAAHGLALPELYCVCRGKLLCLKNARRESENEAGLPQWMEIKL
jgi:hypothetical protein